MSESYHPRVFLSYAWEDTQYLEWVERLAVQLRQDGVAVKLDAWRNKEQPLAAFMNEEVRRAEVVVVLCSPSYQKKVHAAEEQHGRSGAGWEGVLIAERLRSGAKLKVIPILSVGEPVESIPSFLSGHERIELQPRQTNTKARASYRELLRRIYGATKQAPPIGKRPTGLEQPLPAPLFGKPIHTEPAESTTPVVSPQSQASKGNEVEPKGTTNKVSTLGRNPTEAAPAPLAPRWSLYLSGVLVLILFGAAPIVMNLISKHQKLQQQLDEEDSKRESLEKNLASSEQSRDLLAKRYENLRRVAVLAADLGQHDPALRDLSRSSWEVKEALLRLAFQSEALRHRLVQDLPATVRSLAGASRSTRRKLVQMHLAPPLASEEDLDVLAFCVQVGLALEARDSDFLRSAWEVAPRLASANPRPRCLRYLDPRRQLAPLMSSAVADPLAQEILDRCFENAEISADNRKDLLYLAPRISGELAKLNIDRCIQRANQVVDSGDNEFKQTSWIRVAAALTGRIRPHAQESQLKSIEQLVQPPRRPFDLAMAANLGTALGNWYETNKNLPSSFTEIVTAVDWPEGLATLLEAIPEDAALTPKSPKDALSHIERAVIRSNKLEVNKKLVRAHKQLSGRNPEQLKSIRSKIIETLSKGRGELSALVPLLHELRGSSSSEARSIIELIAFNSVGSRRARESVEQLSSYLEPDDRAAVFLHVSRLLGTTPPRAADDIVDAATAVGKELAPEASASVLELLRNALDEKAEAWRGLLEISNRLNVPMDANTAALALEQDSGPHTLSLVLPNIDASTASIDFILGIIRSAEIIDFDDREKIDATLKKLLIEVVKRHSPEDQRSTVTKLLQNDGLQLLKHVAGTLDESALVALYDQAYEAALPDSGIGAGTAAEAARWLPVDKAHPRLRTIGRFLATGPEESAEAEATMYILTGFAPKLQFEDNLQTLRGATEWVDRQTDPHFSVATFLANVARRMTKSEVPEAERHLIGRVGTTDFAFDAAVYCEALLALPGDRTEATVTRLTAGILEQLADAEKLSWASYLLHALHRLGVSPDAKQVRAVLNVLRRIESPNFWFEPAWQSKAFSMGMRYELPMPPQPIECCKRFFQDLTPDAFVAVVTDLLEEEDLNAARWMCMVLREQQVGIVPPDQAKQLGVHLISLPWPNAAPTMELLRTLNKIEIDLSEDDLARLLRFCFNGDQLIQRLGRAWSDVPISVRYRVTQWWLENRARRSLSNGEEAECVTALNDLTPSLTAVQNTQLLFNLLPHCGLGLSRDSGKVNPLQGTARAILAECDVFSPDFTKILWDPLTVGPFEALLLDRIRDEDEAFGGSWWDLDAWYESKGHGALLQQGG